MFVDCWDVCSLHNSTFLLLLPPVSISVSALRAECWTGLGWTGLGRAGLGRAGLGWAGLAGLGTGGGSVQ